MKRKEKSGHEKRCEYKRKELRIAATAPGQKSIFDIFHAKLDSRPITSSESVQEPEQMEDQTETADVGPQPLSDVPNQGKVFETAHSGSKEDSEILEIVDNELTAHPSTSSPLSQK